MIYFLPLVFPMQSCKRLEPDKKIVNECGVRIERTVKEIAIRILLAILHSLFKSFESFFVESAHWQLQIS